MQAVDLAIKMPLDGWHDLPDNMASVISLTENDMFIARSYAHNPMRNKQRVQEQELKHPEW